MDNRSNENITPFLQPSLSLVTKGKITASSKPQGTSCYLQWAEGIISSPKTLPVALEELNILPIMVILMGGLSGNSMTIPCRNEAEAQKSSWRWKPS